MLPGTPVCKEEHNRRDEEHMHCRREHAANDGRRDRLQDVRSDVGTPENRQEPAYRCGDGHELRTQSEGGPSHSRLVQDTLGKRHACGELLVEGRALTPEERADLTVYVVDAAITSPDALTLYRTTSRLLDRLAGTRFATLGLEQRRALLVRHHLDRLPPRGDEDKATPEVAAIRTRIITDLVEGYWSSPSGWADGTGDSPLDFENTMRPLLLESKRSDGAAPPCTPRDVRAARRPPHT